MPHEKLYTFSARRLREYVVIYTYCNKSQCLQNCLLSSGQFYDRFSKHEKLANTHKMKSTCWQLQTIAQNNRSANLIPAHQKMHILKSTNKMHLRVQLATSRMAVSQLEKRFVFVSLWCSAGRNEKNTTMWESALMTFKPRTNASPGVKLWMAGLRVYYSLRGTKASYISRILSV